MYNTDFPTMQDTIDAFIDHPIFDNLPNGKTLSKYLDSVESSEIRKTKDKISERISQCIKCSTDKALYHEPVSARIIEDFRAKGYIIKDESNQHDGTTYSIKLDI